MIRAIGRLTLALALFGTAACTMPQPFQRLGNGADVAIAEPQGDTIRPMPRPGTTASQLPAGPEMAIGETVASLGDATQAGLWLETPLVDAVVQGRVVWIDNGNSTALELRPRDPASGAASLLSLEAMRALGLPLTGLAKLRVLAPS